MGEQAVDVLDHGYVRLIYTAGTELDIVNAARASFEAESASWSRTDERLLAFLIRENHMSPFRHAFAELEVRAPLLVARQWWKYAVGSDHTMDAWNEGSRRYVNDRTEFYVPDASAWRGAPTSKKQGSTGTVGLVVGQEMTRKLEAYCREGEALYAQAQAAGVAAEQARLFLPAYGLYVRWRWAASLQSIAHFLTQRLDEHAQHEIREYAQAVKKLLVPVWPRALPALVDQLAI